MKNADISVGPDDGGVRLNRLAQRLGVPAGEIKVGGVYLVGSDGLEYDIVALLEAIFSKVKDAHV